MFNGTDPGVTAIYAIAGREGRRLGSGFVGCEHLLLAALESRKCPRRRADRGRSALGTRCAGRRPPAPTVGSLGPRRAARSLAA